MGSGLTFNGKQEFVDKIEEFEVLVGINAVIHFVIEEFKK